MKISDNTLKTFRLALKLKAQDKVGLIGDDHYFKLAQLLSRALQEKGYEAYLLKIPNLTQPSQPLDNLIYDFMVGTDALIALTEQSITHSPQTVEAGKKGVKIITMPGVPLASFTKGAMTANFKIIQKRTERLKNKIRGFRGFIIKSSGLEMRIFRGSRPLFGVLGEKYPANLPDGEVFFAPTEGRSEGEFKADFFGGFGRRVFFKVKKGKLVKVNNASREFLKALKKNPLIANVAEMGMGTNDKALKINNILEAEKILGSLHIAFGTNASMGGKVDAGFHMDAVILKPTLFGLTPSGQKKLIIKKGKNILI